MLFEADDLVDWGVRGFNLKQSDNVEEKALPFWDRGLSPSKRLARSEAIKIGHTFRKWTMEKHRNNARHVANKTGKNKRNTKKSANNGLLDELPSFVLAVPDDIANTSKYKKILTESAKNGLHPSDNHLKAKNINGAKNLEPAKTGGFPLDANVIEILEDSAIAAKQSITIDVDISKSSIDFDTKGVEKKVARTASNLQKQDHVLQVSESKAKERKMASPWAKNNLNTSQLDYEYTQLLARHSSAKKRGIAAKRLRLIEKLKYLKREVAPLCSCGTTIYDETPEKCANNCKFFENQRAFSAAIDNLYASVCNVHLR